MKHLWKPLLVSMILLALLAVAVPESALAQTGAAGSCGQTYTVVAGDTLSGIAVNCGVNYTALLNANANITDANQIVPGETINMPSAAANTAAGGVTPTPTATIGTAVTAVPSATGTASALSIPNTGSSSGSNTANNGGSTSGNTSGNNTSGSAAAQTATATPAANNNTGAATATATSAATATPGATATSGAATSGGIGTNNSTSGNPTSTPAASTPAANTTGSNNTVPNTGTTASGRTYTVVTGDTMSSIAAAYNVTLADLEAANPAMSNYDLIFVGDVINLPANAGTGAGSTGSIPNTGGSGKTYTVLLGDTLTAIASENNTTVQALLNANPSITNSDVIFAGQVINLP